MVNFAVAVPPLRFVRAICAQFRHHPPVPFTDPLDRYIHVRADRRALAQLREAHSEEYQRYYDAEGRLIRELVGERSLEDVKAEAKTGPRPESPMRRRVGGCVICAMEKHKEREQSKEPKERKERKRRVPRAVPREPERVPREPERERAPEPVSQEPEPTPKPEELASDLAHEQLETGVSEQEPDITDLATSAGIPKQVTETKWVTPVEEEPEPEDSYAGECDPGDVCEWAWPHCWEDGVKSLLPVGEDPVVTCGTHESKWRRKLRIPDAPRVSTTRA